MRKFFDSYINKQLASVGKMNEEVRDFYGGCPNLSDKPWLEKQLREYLTHARKQSYIQGFWAGWTLREGVEDKI